MDIERFWEIVNKARAIAGSDTEGRVDALRRLLSTESLEEIQSFQSHYDAQIRQSYRWDLWGAAYLLNGGASDDGFRYFRDWLISEGRPIFEAALRSPGSLAALPRVDLAELELFGYVALEIYEEHGGGQLDRDFSTELAMPQGDQWEEDDLSELLPALARKYQ